MANHASSVAVGDLASNTEVSVPNPSCCSSPENLCENCKAGERRITSNRHLSRDLSTLARRPFLLPDERYEDLLLNTADQQSSHDEEARRENLNRLGIDQDEVDDDTLTIPSMFD